MLLLSAVILLAFAVVQWVISLAARDASIADRFWGLGFILVCVAGLRTVDPVTPHKVLLAGLVFLWGARLAIYITWRNWETGEDYRYRAMRAHHGARFAWISFFTVFLLQGFLTWFIALPIQITLMAEDAVPAETALVMAGTLVFGAGLFIEALGDWQLARFKANPENAGKVMDQGLWRYTRHPNYFGEAVVWWGLFLVALPAPNVGFTILSPIVMTLLLLKVSGVPLLEKRMAETRPAYQEYARKTPAFFPWRPRA